MGAAVPNVSYYERVASEYDLFFQDLERNMEEEGERLDSVLRPRGVRTVLDASCGTGRQAIPLARRGYRVTACDPSAAMLDQAAQRARDEGKSIIWHCLPFADLPRAVSSSYDAVIALGNGLCNLDRRHDIVAALGALRACLAPGGVCLVGIKDFDRIRQERPRVHFHRTVRCHRARALLLEIWEYADPLLVCTAYSLCPGQQCLLRRRGRTHEYMLGSADLQIVAQEAGFGVPRRLDHPSEAVFALQ